MVPISKSQVCPLMRDALISFTSKEAVIRSGFMRSGIYPWSPDAVDYSSLPSHANENESGKEALLSDSPEMRLIRLLESRLTIQQFAEFQQHEESVTWPGNITDTNLFYVWRNLKISCNDLCSNAKSDNAVNDEVQQIRGGELSDEESDFKGFSEDEMNRAGVVPQNDSCQITSLASTSLKEVEPEQNNSDKENDVNDVAFNSSFSLPTTTKTTQKRKVLRPPTVATSKEFALFMEAKVKEKEAIEFEKQQKRKEREIKKAQKLAVKEDKKRKPKKPRSSSKSQLQNVRN
ncbi:uncharacterized protein LOC5566876 [Aedes aegypti]|uniref:Uncharacterized protein n=1 Tax=Aedes aegypti TaxID=7159 RepID=A0A6I8TP06_AEDAE|nr:uncharacterized protein LOC5566876 [Aedes aegypti]